MMSSEIIKIKEVLDKLLEVNNILLHNETIKGEQYQQLLKDKATMKEIQNNIISIVSVLETGQKQTNNTLVEVINHLHRVTTYVADALSKIEDPKQPKKHEKGSVIAKILDNKIMSIIISIGGVSVLFFILDIIDPNIFQDIVGAIKVLFGGKI